MEKKTIEELKKMTTEELTQYSTLCWNESKRSDKIIEYRKLE